MNLYSWLINTRSIVLLWRRFWKIFFIRRWRLCIDQFLILIRFHFLTIWCLSLHFKLLFSLFTKFFLFLKISSSFHLHFQFLLILQLLLPDFNLLFQVFWMRLSHSHLLHRKYLCFLFRFFSKFFSSFSIKSQLLFHFLFDFLHLRSRFRISKQYFFSWIFIS